MTAATNGHGHGHEQPQQPFIPDPHFAVQAQQEEIERLRGEVKNVNDRNVYLRAVVLQIQAEAQHQASLHMGEIENYKNEITKLRKRLFDVTGDEGDNPEAPMRPVGPDDPEAPVGFRDEDLAVAPQPEPAKEDVA